MIFDHTTCSLPGRNHSVDWIPLVHAWIVALATVQGGAAIETTANIEIVVVNGCTMLAARHAHASHFRPEALPGIQSFHPIQHCTTTIPTAGHIDRTVHGSASMEITFVHHRDAIHPAANDRIILLDGIEGNGCSY